jgi:RNA ligase
MGITEVAMQAEVYVAQHPQYGRMAKDFYQDFTPIFEWCSRQQQIVIDYPEDQLVLIAIRYNRSGDYVHYNQMKLIADFYEIPVVKTHDFSGYSPQDLAEAIRAWEGSEGVVIRFDDGHMVKIKANDYVRLHRAVSMIETDRHVVAIILEEQLDDLIPLLPERHRERVAALQDKVWKDILLFQTRVNAMLSALQSSNTDRKTFALNSGSVDPMLKSFVFKFFDQETCPLDSIKDVIAKHLSKNSSFEKIKDSILRSI